MTNSTPFPVRARRPDPHGHMVVQSMLEYLRDRFDAFTNRLIHGSVTVPQPTTTLVVTHGLGSPNYAVQLTPTTSYNGNWWVSSKTSSSFQINLSNPAPSGGASFDWIVEGAYP